MHAPSQPWPIGTPAHVAVYLLARLRSAFPMTSRGCAALPGLLKIVYTTPRFSSSWLAGSLLSEQRQEACGGTRRGAANSALIHPGHSVFSAGRTFEQLRWKHNRVVACHI